MRRLQWAVKHCAVLTKTEPSTVNNSRFSTLPGTRKLKRKKETLFQIQQC